ncbi:MAG: hypothetical protein ACXVRU_14365 [Gaiellaceae bacterium]
MVLVLWIGGLSPDAWRTSMQEELAKVGVEACRVHSVVDDGILDVHVDVSSAADARRLTDAAARLGRERAGVTLAGAWSLCAERVEAVAGRGRRRPAREPAHQT